MVGEQLPAASPRVDVVDVQAEHVPGCQGVEPEAPDHNPDSVLPAHSAVAPVAPVHAAHVRAHVEDVPAAPVHDGMQVESEPIQPRRSARIANLQGSGHVASAGGVIVEPNTLRQAKDSPEWQQ